MQAFIGMIMAGIKEFVMEGMGRIATTLFPPFSHHVHTMSHLSSWLLWVFCSLGPPGATGNHTIDLQFFAGQMFRAREALFCLEAFSGVEAILGGAENSMEQLFVLPIFKGCRIVFFFLPHVLVFFGFLSWHQLPCICNSLELEPVIFHGIFHILALQPLICMVFAIYILDHFGTSNVQMGFLRVL